jgi:DNA polymerase II small subunit
MIGWIKRSENEAEHLKYLILSGDVIDGIGVYPGQEEDLELVNPLEQYELLASYLQEIPEDIQVFVMPGNHDTVRLAEPQPNFSGKIQEIFPDNSVMLPNPYTLKLEGKNVLLYHGMSLNDMVELVPGANFTSIGKAIEEVLRRRHLAPKYGGKTPLIPSPNDYHVIEEVPDIFITGHIHSHYLGNYKGVRYVNSSTWQSQTDYQKMMNFAPNPSILTMFDLHSKSTILKNFEVQQ